MPKDVPDCPSAPPRARKRKTERENRFTIKLITPMFGGGAEAGSIDPDFPIRPTAIRGNLQFWWRATVGARFDAFEKLREAQSEVWGSTKRESPVKVLVRGVQSSEPEPCAAFEWNPRANRGRGAWRINWRPPFDNSDLPYALFPFQGEAPPPDLRAEVMEPPAFCVREATFELILRCPAELWEHVESAVWAWVNFGGLGSRTRRGCGAIWCEQFSPKDSDELAEELMRRISPRSESPKWPILAESVLTRPAKATRPGPPVDAWDWLIGCYKYFRQGAGFARDPGARANQPKRSRYPEPDAIRRLTGRHSEGHAPRPEMEMPDGAFPRAEFGLPIVFHFKDAGDPADTVLHPSNGPRGERRERMASPLILKPLALADRRAISLILRLKTPPLDGVELRERETPLTMPKTTVIREPRLESYPNSPLAGLSPNGSALEAFLTFARDREGFKEALA